MSFNSAEALTKHMNRHFQDTPSPSKKKASRDVSGKVHHKTSVSAARTPFAKPEAVEELFEGGEEVVEGASAKVIQQTQSKGKTAAGHSSDLCRLGSSPFVTNNALQ